MKSLLRFLLPLLFCFLNSNAFCQWQSTNISQVQNVGNRISVKTFFNSDILIYAYVPQLGFVQADIDLQKWDTVNSTGLNGPIEKVIFGLNSEIWAFGRDSVTKGGRLYKNKDHFLWKWKLDTAGLPAHPYIKDEKAEWIGSYTFRVRGNVYTDFAGDSRNNHYVLNHDSAFWVEDKLMYELRNYRAIHAPSNPQTYYLTVATSGAMYFTQLDYGTFKWIDLGMNPKHIWVTHLERTFDRLVVAGTNLYGKPVLFTREDISHNWVERDLSGISGMGFDSLDYQQITDMKLIDNRIYLSLSPSDTSTAWDIYGSTDFGRTWKAMQEGLPLTADPEIKVRFEYVAGSLLAVPDCGEPYFMRMPLSVNQIEDEQLNIYPNPGHSLFKIDGLRGGFTARVFDVNGKLVLTTNDTQFDLEGKAPGLYMIRILTSHSVIERKLILR